MFAAIGDLHLEKLTKLIPASLDLQLQTLESTLRGIENQGIRHVVLLGDVMDNPYPAQSTVRRFLDTLEARDLFYHILLGNHDVAGVDVNGLDLVEWIGRSKRARVRVYTKPVLRTIDGVKCWLCPHPYTTSPPKGTELCFGHFPWSGAKRDNGSREPERPTPKGNWVLGDFHTHQTGNRFVYAGSLTQLSFAERLPKGYLLIDGANVTFESIKPAYRLLRADIRSVEDLAALSKKALYSVTVAADLKLPSDWQLSHPNIVRVDASVKKRKNDVFMPSVFELEGPLDGLRAWLKKRGNLSKSERILAMKEAQLLHKVLNA